MNYEHLDDSDIWSALKEWTKSEDRVLALLASDLVNRNIFKVEIHEECPTEEEITELKERLAAHFGISTDDAAYLVSLNTIQKDMYDIHDDHIAILYKDGTLKDVAESSEMFNVSLLSKKIRKYYLCYQRIS